MKLNKSYTIAKLDTEIIQDKVIVSLSYGSIEGYRDSLCYPEKSFSTEEEALNYILDNEMWGEYTVIPVYSLSYSED